MKSINEFITNKAIDYIPGARAAFALGNKVNIGLKLIFLLIVLILSIVFLAESSKVVKNTKQGKITLTISIVLFLMTLAMPFLRRLRLDTNFKVVSYFMVYLTLALVATILSFKTSKELKKSNKDVKAANNTKRAVTGITVMAGLFLIIGAMLFKMFDKGVNYWAMTTYFVKPQL
jgi:hypothetical protein